MYILSENGQEAFSKFMSNLVTQSVLGSICLLLLYRAVHLPIWTYQWLVFWIFTLAIISFLFFWCFSSFMQFIKPGEFKHEVRQFQKPYDNQQAEQISLMV